MAKETQGKRTASKAALKKAPAGRRSIQAKSNGAFPGAARKSEREVERMVPRVKRS